MSQKSPHNRKNPLKPQRNLKDFIKFTAIAILLIILIDYVIFKGERPYITKMKQDYYAEQAEKQRAIEEALPPKIIYPETGDEYFESPMIELKDEQSLLPEKQFNITKILPVIEEPKEEGTKQPPKLAEIKKPEKPPVKKFSGKNPKIAIVIDDVGMNLTESKRAINLPAPITLAMLPYASKVKEMAYEGKAKGHELIIHTPMEAMSSKVDLGGLALRSNMQPQVFKAEFDKIASSFDGYVGINNHMGSRLTQDPKAMKMVMAELKKRNLYFLDSRTINTSIGAETAQTSGIPNATRDVFLDHEETPEFVLNALLKTEKIAKEKGYAIAIGHPKDVTMSALQKWIPTLKAKGIELVPLSHLVDNNGATVKSAPIIKQAVQKDKVKMTTTKPEKPKAKIDPEADSETEFYNSDLTPEEENIIIKPIEVQNKENGYFVVREAKKEITMEKALPVVSYPVN